MAKIDNAKDLIEYLKKAKNGYLNPTDLALWKKLFFTEKNSKNDDIRKSGNWVYIAEGKLGGKADRSEDGYFINTETGFLIPRTAFGHNHRGAGEGSAQEFNNMVLHMLNAGNGLDEFPSFSELKTNNITFTDGKDGYDNIKKDIEYWFESYGIDKMSDEELYKAGFFQGETERFYGKWNKNNSEYALNMEALGLDENGKPLPTNTGGSNIESTDIVDDNQLSSFSQEELNKQLLEITNSTGLGSTVAGMEIIDFLSGNQEGISSDLEDKLNEERNNKGSELTEAEINNIIKNAMEEAFVSFYTTNDESVSPEQAKDIYRRETTVDKNEFNAYTRYMERMQLEDQHMQYGLLREQTAAGKQMADIAAQQAMMQQAQIKDQIIEQIKSDRLGKMRQGISPMQIANEELQMMVGGMQQNTQMMSQVNQQQLGAYQQDRMNPYQAYINSQQSVTGGQGYANFAAGLAATDASSLDAQAKLRMMQTGETYPIAYEKVKLNTNQNID